MEMGTLYGEDLAYIHDVGFGRFAASASRGILGLLRRKAISSGLVVDLGCGSGILAKALLLAGYEVLGIDSSSAMVRLARRQAPGATFVCDSLRSFRLPACDAVTAIGECLNYRSATAPKFNPDTLFRRIFAALRPGGVFVFDIAEAALADEDNGKCTIVEGKDWMVVSEKYADSSRHRLRRRIIAYRRIGRLYRRSEEIHDLELLKRTEVLGRLQASGFRARVISAYGTQRLLPGRVGFVAIKPKR